MGPANEVGPEQISRLKEVLGWVRDFTKAGFAAGTNHFTLADICFLATYSSVLATEVIDVAEVKLFFRKYFNYSL
jgi:hypothetical protein